MSTGDRREERRKAAKRIADRAHPTPLGWPVDESPRLSYPDRVEYDGDEWEVIEVDILGRWLCVQEYDEWHEERYLDPADLTVPPVYDNRPLYRAEDITSMGYMMRRAVEVTMETYKDALVQQLEQPNHLLGLLQR